MKDDSETFINITRIPKRCQKVGCAILSNMLWYTFIEFLIFVKRGTNSFRLKLLFNTATVFISLLGSFFHDSLSSIVLSEVSLPKPASKGLVSACSENMLDLYRKFLWYRLIFIELKLAKSYKSSITIDLYSLDKFWGSA